MILNSHDKALLIALRRGEHFRDNPGDVVELLKASFGDVGPSAGQSSARRLYSEGLAIVCQDSEKPGLTLLRITDTGIALADNFIEERREKTWKERLAEVPRSDWIALIALIVSAIALLKPGS